MTSPVVGTVSVEILGDVKRLAASVRSEFQGALKGLDFGKAIRESAGDAKIRVSADTTGVREQIALAARDSKAKVKVDVDSDSARTVIGGITDLFKGLSGVTPTISGLTSGFGNLAGSLQSVGAQGAQAGSTLAGSMSAVAGPIGIAISLGAAMAAAIGGMTVAAFALGPALGLISAGLAAVAGAAAAIPGALAGAGAVIGTFALGFKGIQEAFKPKTGGGGGGGGQDAASKARQIAAAERGVESARRGIASATRGVEAAERSYADAQLRLSDAQKKVVTAQEAVNRARKEAAEDIDDLGRALRGAVLDEESAALGVSEALRALNAAKETGVLPDIERADLAYRQAQLTLENAKDSVQDLGDESADSAKKGVDGSDKVQSALADQADAVRGVHDAQNGLISAQDGLLSAQDSLKSSTDGLASAQDSLAEAQKKVGGGAAGVAAQVIKLAPAAQRFVDAVKALKPAFEDLRLDVQQRLFAGLDKTVTNLGRAWIPALKVTLGSYADTFNGFFKNLGSGISDQEFIKNIQAGAEGARKGISAVGDSITKSLVPAFGALARASGPFLHALGDEIAGIVTDFSNWVLQGEKTGGLDDFFSRATSAMHDLFDTGKLVVQIVGAVFDIITGSGKRQQGKSALDGLNEGLTTLRDYLRDPATQQKIRDFFQTILGALENFKGAAGSVQGVIAQFQYIRERLFGDKTGSHDQAYSFGEDIGAALVYGVIAGVSGANDLLGKLVAGLIWSGPNSLVGKIKSGLGIASPSTVMIGVGRDVVLGLIGGIAGKFASLAGTVAQIPGRILAAIGNAGGLLVNAGRNFVGGAIAGISSKLGDLQNRAGGMRTAVSNALSNAGSLLVSAGRNIINGLINGISNAIPSLGSVLERVTNLIPKKKGPIEKDRVLLFGAGQAIMGGLIGGIDDRKSDLAAKLSDVTGLVAGTPFGDLGAAGDLAISKSLTASAKTQLELSWLPSMRGDKILDAIRGEIGVSFRGDPMAALQTG